MAANIPRRPLVSHCLGRQPAAISPNKTVCILWLNGKCNRTPCRFLHCEMPVSCATKQSHTESYGPEKEKATSIRLKNNTYIRFKNKLVLDKSSHEDVADKKIVPPNIEERGSSTLEDASKSSSQKGGESCTHGSSCNNKCQFQNSGHCVEELTTLACLQGHTKAIMGIALPECSNKLYSGCSDGTIRIWDCSTAQCARVIDLGNEIGSTISKGGWLFVGMRNVVKVWNTQSGAEYNLDGFTALIYVMETTDDMLFSGGQDGIILAWKGSNETNIPLQPVASLQGHKCDALSLAVGHGWLYSGSKDHTIRVWDPKTLECVKTLDGHADTVTSLVCWDQYLLSGSLDRTIRVWAINEKCNLEVIYTHNEEHGILAFCGMIDGNDKPILCCSFCDNSVHLYDLPSFATRGKLFSNHDVGAMQMGPMREGLFFTGDQAGVWDLKTLECVKTLDGHADTVTFLVCWAQYLLSSSMDCTIRVWAMNKKHNFEVIYTHNEEHDILAFCGMINGNDKPILCCSFCDNSVHLYDLPSFATRGKLFSNHDVGAMQMGPMREGLFFTGDQAGVITVWKWLPKLKASHQE